MLLLENIIIVKLINKIYKMKSTHLQVKTNKRIGNCEEQLTSTDCRQK